MRLPSYSILHCHHLPFWDFRSTSTAHCHRVTLSRWLPSFNGLIHNFHYFAFFVNYLFVLQLTGDKRVTWLSGHVFNVISHRKHDHISHDLPLNTFFSQHFRFFTPFLSFLTPLTPITMLPALARGWKMAFQCVSCLWHDLGGQYKVSFCMFFAFFDVFPHFFIVFQLILTHSPQAAPTPPSMWKGLTRMARTWWVSACHSLFSTFFAFFPHFFNLY